jgi:hypothetical protein
MSKMRFDVKVVKEFLVKNGFVLTVRGYDYGIKSKSFVEGVGEVQRLRLRVVNRKEDIMGFEKYSGFNSVDEWWNKIASFGACNGFLYRVSKKEGSR